MNAQHTPREAEGFVTSNGIAYTPFRGAAGYGWFVIASRPDVPRSTFWQVCAGPYTNEADATSRAQELRDEHDRNLAGDDRRAEELVARGLDELAARRTAAALGVELGPLTEAEVAATAELERTAGELGLDLDDAGTGNGGGLGGAAIAIADAAEVRR